MATPKPTAKREVANTTPAKPVGGADASVVVAKGAPVPEPPRPPQVQLLRGMKDILPSDQPLWDTVRRIAETLTRAYGYQRVETPLLEDESLFTRAVGKTTDIVEKEMFAFTDQGGDRVALRPEGTAGVVRAYIEHGMQNQPQPMKLWYFGPMFRYDRPQAGRLRQFHQFGLEVLGERHPGVDAELILIGVNFFRALGTPVSVQVNSIGCPVCRPPYEQELQNYLKTRRADLCEACKRRMQRGAFLRVLDCKEAGCRGTQEGAPQLVDWLCEVCKQHFIRVLEYLDELEVPYALSPFLVRGLDYYTKTAFEFLPADARDDGAGAPSAQSSLGGGGRYDGLAELLGGRPTPGAGWAIGIERAIMKAKEAIAAGRLAAPERAPIIVYLAQLGEQGKRKAMKLFEELRAQGMAIAANFAKDSLKGQLEHANRLGVRFTIILGQKEVIDGTIIIREMSSGIQEIVAFEKVISELQKRITQDDVRASVTEPVVPAEPVAGAAPPSRPPKDDLPPVPTIEEYEDGRDPEKDAADPASESSSSSSSS